MHALTAWPACAPACWIYRARGAFGCIAPFSRPKTLVASRLPLVLLLRCRCCTHCCRGGCCCRCLTCCQHCLRCCNCSCGCGEIGHTSAAPGLAMAHVAAAGVARCASAALLTAAPANSQLQAIQLHTQSIALSIASLFQLDTQQNSAAAHRSRFA